MKGTLGFLLINFHFNSHTCLMATILDKAILRRRALQSAEVEKQERVQGEMWSPGYKSQGLDLKVHLRTIWKVSEK